jgi:hypothetical protein
MSNTQQNDRAIDLANFIANESTGLGADAIASMEERFGDLTQDQFERGILTGQAMLDEQATALEAHAAELREFATSPTRRAAS